MGICFGFGMRWSDLKRNRFEIWSSQRRLTHCVSQLLTSSNLFFVESEFCLPLWDYYE